MQALMRFVWRMRYSQNAPKSGGAVVVRSARVKRSERRCEVNRGGESANQRVKKVKKGVGGACFATRNNRIHATARAKFAGASEANGPIGRSDDRRSSSGAVGPRARPDSASALFTFTLDNVRMNARNGRSNARFADRSIA